MARAPVSKTGGWGFESLHSCQGQAPRPDCTKRAKSPPLIDAKTAAAKGLIRQSDLGIA